MSPLNRAAGLLAALTSLTSLISLPALGVAAPAPGTPLKECRVAGIANSVQCGAVRRPLDPARPNGGQIDVHYVVVPAMARQKLADPVFLLAGGPGQSAIALAPALMPLFARLNNRRDIVFVDQRGTGRSAPLQCDDTSREPFSGDEDPEQQIAALKRCRVQLEKLPHVNGAEGLRHYTTTTAMQDLDAVRRQLGAARIDLVGASYGTRAALEYMRQYPTAVRRSVLDGVMPPDMAVPAAASIDAQAAFDALFAACEREAACARAYPALRADWKALLQSLPKQVVAVDALTGTHSAVRLTREVLLGTVRGPLYVPALAAALPAAIHAAARGHYEALVGLASMLASRKGTQLAMGMHFSVVCAEDAPLLTSANDRPGADFGTDFAQLYRRVCADWPRGDVAAAFYRVPPATSAVLLLSGGSDPATPPRHAARIAAALGPFARHVVVPNAGHGIIGIGCMRDVLFRFIDAENDKDALAVDTGCALQIPRPLAFQPVASAPKAASR
ncbi:MAG: alpha/beta hydrolase [Pseudomonadota bacterium]|nr:alpha/beta hydrolase [Pseudomonadota bacterium]